MRTNILNTGKTFEHILERIWACYDKEGIAKIHKVDPPTRMFGSGKNKQVIFLENPWLDYAGVIYTGRMVVIEAKSTIVPALPTGARGLTDRQLDAMVAWNKAGAWAFVLWELHGQARYLRIHEALRARSLRRSVHWDEAYPLKPGLGNEIWRVRDVWTPPENNNLHHE